MRLLVIIHKFLLHFRFMVMESYDYQEVEKTMMYYGTPLVRESDFPFNFYLLYLPQNTSGLWVKDLVHLWMANMPKGKWPNWVVSQESEASLDLYPSHILHFLPSASMTDPIHSPCLLPSQPISLIYPPSLVFLLPPLLSGWEP